MTRMGRILVMSLSLLIGMPSVELVREKLIYLRMTRKLETGYSQIKPNMTKEQVKQVVGEPDSVTSAGDGWYWDAMHHQGGLWRGLGLTTVKGHYVLAVTFNDKDEVANVWAGVN